MTNTPWTASAYVSTFPLTCRELVSCEHCGHQGLCGAEPTVVELWESGNGDRIVHTSCSAHAPDVAAVIGGREGPLARRRRWELVEL